MIAVDRDLSALRWSAVACVRFVAASLFCLGMLPGGSLPTKTALGAELAVETIEDAPPTEGMSEEMVAQFGNRGFKVTSGKSKTVCEFWPRTVWPVQEDFVASSTIQYPFEFGELVGLMRYKRKGSDFRGRVIPAGVYTVRYALQPVDGNHVGTSDTRDFALLLPASEDKTVAPLEKDALFKLSKQAAGTSHPAMLCLLGVGEAGVDLPRMTHEESRDLWSLQFENAAAAGDKTSKLALSLVVLGKAE